MSTIRWGWYCLEKEMPIVGCVAGAHTYAAIRGNDGPWFDCYGGHSSSKNHYPEASGDCSKRLAVTICCFDPDDPRGNTEESFDRKSGGALGFGDCSGVIYGVSGVCHQMANRILWEAGLNVQSAPGYWGTYSVYGLWGGPERPDWTWPAYLAACKVRAGWSGVAPAYTGLAQRMVENENEVGTTGSDVVHERRIHLAVEERLGAEYSASKLSKLTRIHLGFIESKAKADGERLARNVGGDLHATQVNALHRSSLMAMNEVLGSNDFKALFGFPAEIHPPLINPLIATNLSEWPAAALEEAKIGACA